MFLLHLQISTKTDKHFFTSFAARDKTYTMLFKLWLNAQLHQVGHMVTGPSIFSRSKRVKSFEVTGSHGLAIGFQGLII
jgi:hypothetical protein